MAGSPPQSVYLHCCCVLSHTLSRRLALHPCSLVQLPLFHPHTTKTFATTQAFGTQHAKTRKVGALQAEVKALQEAEVAARTEYQKVRDRNVEVRRIMC